MPGVLLLLLFPFALFLAALGAEEKTLPSVFDAPVPAYDVASLVNDVNVSRAMAVTRTKGRLFDCDCRALVDDINSKPLYTVYEYWEGHQVKPDKILVLGGPAVFFADQIEKVSGIKTAAVPKCAIANALGAAFARTTCEVSLFADTQRGIMTAPEENFFERIGSSFTRDDAQKKTLELLTRKARKCGATSDDLEMDILENQQFNMVRGFSAAGRNIRIKAQVRPGLISGYQVIADKLSKEIVIMNGARQEC